MRKTWSNWCGSSKPSPKRDTDGQRRRLTAVFIPARRIRDRLLNTISRFCAIPPKRLLKLFLRAVAVHSFFVGMVLVIQPAAVIRMLGFEEINNTFFPCQGGVFHMVMAIAYIYGAIDIHKNKNMIIYAVIVKISASVFLFSYYFFIERLWIIFLSAMIDFLMSAVIWGLLGYTSFRSKTREATGS